MLPCRLVVIQFWLLSYTCAAVQPLSLTPWPEINSHVRTSGAFSCKWLCTRGLHKCLQRALPSHAQPVQINAEGKRGSRSDRGDCCREKGGVRLIMRSVSLLTAAPQSEG